MWNKKLKVKYVDDVLLSRTSITLINRQEFFLYEYIRNVYDSLSEKLHVISMYVIR